MRYESPPSEATFASRRASFGEISACHTIHSGKGLISFSKNSSGTFDHICKESQPPSSIFPSCGCLNGYQSTYPLPFKTSSFHLSSLRSSSTGCSRYHSIYLIFSMPACFIGLQNSTVHEKTPICSYDHSSNAPVMTCLG